MNDARIVPQHITQRLHSVTITVHFQTLMCFENVTKLTCITFVTVNDCSVSNVIF